MQEARITFLRDFFSPSGLPGNGVPLPEEEEFFRVLGLQESFVRQRLELIQSLESSSGAAEKSPELEECLAVLIRVLLKKAEVSAKLFHL